MPMSAPKVCAGRGCGATTYAKFCDPCRQRNCRVFLVIGPSGSGKSTWVRKQAKPGDLVIDFDLIFKAISLQPIFEKPTNLLPFVLAARDAMLKLIGNYENTGAAYIIRNKITRVEIEAFRREFDAKIVLLKVAPDECIRRIEADPTRPASQLQDWRNRINEWWDEHRYLDVTPLWPAPPKA